MSALLVFLRVVQIILYFLMFGFGYLAGSHDTECWMRAGLLAELLETDPEKRSERILDLCFYVISDEMNRGTLNEKVLPEVLQHLEKRIRQPGMILRESEKFGSLTRFEDSTYFISSRKNPGRQPTEEDKRYWNIPTLEYPMGFEREIKTVEKCIEEYKKRKGDASKETEGCKREHDAGSKVEDWEFIDLEKGDGY
ncbi:hypothetical protein DSL72_006641 [Monilinia vaccinii-corymbosi]|uniref:Uncharacterized protein n=1 Tax=Monilinia vaccinii-corymbosi TaxID=61207 RepID=A0A8A3PMX3_9HELO|nr:hypothetical protein DSL72_006641 [Monilinia vaccinii-corymbosi]